MNRNMNQCSKDWRAWFWRRSRAALFALAVGLVTSMTATGWADSLYIVTDDDSAGSAVILESQQAEVPDFSSQLISVTNGGRGYDILLAEDTEVTVRHEGSIQTLQSKRESVTSLLNRMHIVPGPLEIVGVDLSESGVELTVDSEIVYYERVTERAAYETVRVENPELPEGEERVTQAGANGVRTSVYEVVWSNGQELSRQFVEELESTAVDKIVEYGTAKPAPSPKETVSQSKPAPVKKDSGGVSNASENADGSGVLHLKDGTTLTYSGVRTMTATAYTSGHDGVGTRTASGTAVHVGTVAVDKSVIPLGTRMYIVADGGIVYGLCVAEDTGVRGSKVDLYFDTYEECIQFGRRKCTVYILE